MGARPAARGYGEGGREEVSASLRDASQPFVHPTAMASARNLIAASRLLNELPKPSLTRYCNSIEVRD